MTAPAPHPGGWRERAGEALQRAWADRSAASTALLPLSWLYGAAMSARRALYDRGVLPVHPLPARVVVVGNLLAGGAGKTPTVIAIVELLRRHGWTPAIVSRGYGRAHDDVRAVRSGDPAREVGDEPLVLARRTGVPVVVGRDRVAACHAVLQAHPEVDVIVSDDGLQHRALGRDVEVLVFDERGFGNGRLLPAGPMREQLPGAAGTSRVVLYNAPAPTTPLPGFLGRRALAGLVALDGWWRQEPATLSALDALRGKPVVAAAGLARPGRFFAMLRDRGLDIIELPLPDHHDFTALPWPLTTADVVVTEKDAVKIEPTRALGSRVWVAALDFAPEPGFEDALLSLLPAAPPPASASHGNPPA